MSQSLHCTPFSLVAVTCHGRISRKRGLKTSSLVGSNQALASRLHPRVACSADLGVARGHYIRIVTRFPIRRDALPLYVALVGRELQPRARRRSSVRPGVRADKEGDVNGTNARENPFAPVTRPLLIHSPRCAVPRWMRGSPWIRSSNATQGITIPSHPWKPLGIYAGEDKASSPIAGTLQGSILGSSQGFSNLVDLGPVAS